MKQNNLHSSPETLQDGPVIKTSKIVYLSHLLENIEIRSHVFISVFMLTQTLLESVFPCFLLLISQKINLPGVHLLSQNEAQGGEENTDSNLLYFIIQLISLALLIGILIGLFFINRKTINIKTFSLYSLTIFHYLWGLFTWIEVNIFYHFMQSDDPVIVLQMICSMNILLGGGLSILYKIIAHSYGLAPPNFLCSRFGVVEIIGDITSKIIITLINFQVAQQNHLKITNTNSLTTLPFILFIITLNKLKNQVRSYTYAEHSTEKIYQSCLLLQFSCLLITIICLLTKQQLLIKNYFYVIFSVFFFFYLMLGRYIERRSISIQLKKQSEIKTADQAILFIREISKLFLTKFQNLQGSEVYMIRRLYQNHQNQCLDVECFCRDSDSQKSSKLLIKMVSFYEFLVIKMFEKFCFSIKEKKSDIVKIFMWTKLKIHQNFIRVSALNSQSNFKQINDGFMSKIFLQKYDLEVRKVLENKGSLLNLSKIEKVFASDQLAEATIEKSCKIIELKISFWNGLVKGVIDQSFQTKLLSQLALLKELHQYTETAFEKYAHSFTLLSLMITYQRTILLKQRISEKLLSFIDKLCESERSLRNLIKRKSVSQIEKVMYSNFACSLEISTIPEELGKIISVSKNARNIFKLEEKSLIGANINKVMPLKMQGEHNRMLRNWTQTCAWGNMAKVKNVYCLDSANVCLAGKVYLKPIQRLENVNILGLFLQQNDQDYLLIDNQNVVVSAGHRFINALGSKIINMPLQLICDEKQKIQTWANGDENFIHQLEFYSTKPNSQIFCNDTKNGFNLEIRQRICDKVAQIKAVRLEKIAVAFTVGKFQFGSLSLKYLKLVQFCQYSLTKKQSQNLLATDESQKIKKNKQSFRKNQSKAILAFNPSLRSSSTQEQTTSTYNMLAKLQKIFYSSQKIDDRRVWSVVLALCILCLAIFFVDIYKIFINEKGYKQIQQLLFADSACSDNLEFSMIMYNKALSVNIKMQAYLSQYDFTLFDSTLFNPLLTELKQLAYERDYLNGLVTSQLLKYQKSITSLNGIHMFQYQGNLVRWENGEGQQIMITALQFIQNFVFFCGKISNLSIQTLRKSKTNIIQGKQIQRISAHLSFLIGILKANFEELQKINNEYLVYYENLQSITKQTIKTYTYIKMALTIMITFIIVVILISYLRFRQDQNQKTFQIYKFITQDLANDLVRYYWKLLKPFKTYISFKNIKENLRTQKISIDSHKLIQGASQIYEEYYQKEQSQLLTKSQSIKLQIYKIKNKKMKGLLALIFLLVIGLNVLILKSQSTILDRTYEIILLINDLIQSENELISVYLTERSFSNLNNNHLEGLLARINNVQVDFNKLIVSSFKLLTDFDPGYLQKMKEMLSKSICQVAQDYLPPQFYSVCLKEDGMQIGRAGIINQMNYFNRQLSNLLLNDIKTGSGRTQSKFFELEKVDRALLHMFKVYQNMQALMISSLNLKIASQKSELIFYMSMELVLFFAFAYYLRIFYFTQNKKSSDRVGRILTLPARLVENQVRMLKNFQAAIDYYNILIS